MAALMTARCKTCKRELPKEEFGTAMQEGKVRVNSFNGGECRLCRNHNTAAYFKRTFRGMGDR